MGCKFDTREEIGTENHKLSCESKPTDSTCILLMAVVHLVSITTNNSIEQFRQKCDCSLRGSAQSTTNCVL